MCKFISLLYNTAKRKDKLKIQKQEQKVTVKKFEIYLFLKTFSLEFTVYAALGLGTQAFHYYQAL
jgi:hypothetical protein